MDLEQIYVMYFNDLYRYLFSLTRNHAETEDLLQETFIKAHIALLANDIDEIKPWLFKVGYYTFIDRTRKEKRYVITDKFTQKDFNTPENIVTENNSYEELLGYLDKINPMEKQAILLCDVHDCTYEQAANILNIKLNTLKSHVSRGRKKLRKMLTKEEG
ncbi:sigma-70 family RNA polymerase sigma factor [Ornithinibacillus halotolerans]|uniref:ECF RNA polymerase sigma factor SigM n=1 Tax=Ornithinibacillus halotolerans TaxID=1274357 RepID=A0A916S9J7_9BACI|nr:sigma-70 family RNA polymerase sigma factor [Ornithinibacillus halotolerans]GGA90776.1 ECF RNA polymerase sigma factor SigM [Ornithinibacillus halotolerans]